MLARGALYLVLNNNRSLLLNAGKDNAHRQARQLPNGYYAGLVDRETLVGKLAKAGARVSAIGSNGHYAVLRHALHGRTVTPKEARVAARAFAAATERDLASPDQGAFGATGQRCTAASRAVVVDSVADACAPSRPCRRAASAPECPASAGTSGSCCSPPRGSCRSSRLTNAPSMRSSRRGSRDSVRRWISTT